MPDKVVIEVGKDGWTGSLQLGISQLDENGSGWGHRLAGPKFNGSGETLLSRTLDERDAKEIRGYLDAVFPQQDEAARWRAAFEALHARILRDLPGDGSELAPPDDPFWAAQLDGLMTYAGEVARETETETTR